MVKTLPSDANSFKIVSDCNFMLDPKINILHAVFAKFSTVRRHCCHSDIQRKTEMLFS